MCRAIGGEALVLRELLIGLESPGGHLAVVGRKQFDLEDVLGFPLFLGQAISAFWHSLYGSQHRKTSERADGASGRPSLLRDHVCHGGSRIVANSDDCCMEGAR